MKLTKSRFKPGRMAVAGALVVGSLFAGQAAFACTVDNWSANSGNVIAGGPLDGVPRYSGLCAMETPDGTVAYVQDNSPAGISRIIARFYVLANNTEAADVYRGFNAGGTEMFNVSVATNGTVTLASGNDSVTSPSALINKWNSIEIDWSPNTDEVRLSVNGEPFNQNSASLGLTDTLHSVRLGNLNGAAGSLNFDAYESRRSTNVGRLLVGDANASGTVNVVDASAIVSELDGTFQSGQPDCNENGVVNIVDASCVVTLL